MFTSPHSVIASSSECSGHNRKLVSPGSVIEGFVLCNVKGRPRMWKTFLVEIFSHKHTVIALKEKLKSKEFFDKFLMKQASLEESADEFTFSVLVFYLTCT